MLCNHARPAWRKPDPLNSSLSTTKLSATRSEKTFGSESELLSSPTSLQAMKLLQQLQRDGLADPHLEFCVYLPDAVHVRKSCKCSFSNWFCLFDNCRVSLAVVHTLREDNDFAIQSHLRKLLTKEDVKNKDRMAVAPMTRLRSPAVLKVLSSTKSVRKAGLYPHPIFICLDPMANSSSWTTLH